MSISVVVPAVGESIHEVQIAQWLKKEGQWVEKDENLVEVESDKATVQLPAPVAGRLAKILKQRGEIAAVGEVIAELDDAATPQSSIAPPKPTTELKAAAKQPTKTGHVGVPPLGGGELAPAKAGTPTLTAQTGEPPVLRTTEPSLAAKRLLGEFGLAPADVFGTGPQGELLPEDILRHVRQSKESGRSLAISPSPTPTMQAVPAAHDDELEEVVPMSMIRRRIAERLVEAQHTAALLTTFNEVDMTEVMDLRSRFKETFQERYGVKLGFMSFFVKAAVEALRRFPQVNAEIRGRDIVFRNYYDIGIAVGGGKGLVVPVLRRTELLSFAEIEQQIGRYAAKAQENKLTPAELQGGTFTISNGGIYGSMLSTPIVNPPQSGILGLHAIQDRPVARDKQVVIRPMMYLALTYDHRLVDGREAVGFLKTIKDVIEDPTRLLLEI